jgi:pimeloyl-ACP methyl ester carboxylesterase
MDAASEARKIVFDRVGSGETVLLISGFPQTRRSWNKLIPLLSQNFRIVAADLPSFGDSGILAAPATYYFRMSPMFETSAPKYDWMNRIIAIGTGYRRADGPIYSIFEVL